MTVHSRVRRILFAAWLGLFLLPVAVCAASPAGIDRLVGPMDAVALAAPDGRILFAHNPRAPRIPASTLKIVTALAALDTLGPDFRFATEFYLDPRDNLIVRGLGDPLLTSGTVADIAVRLARIVPRFNDLVLDAGYFSDPLTIPGVSDTDNPYDAPNGALCVNFNTIAFVRDGKGRIIAGEPETPMFPYARRIIGNRTSPDGRIAIPGTDHRPVFYAGHLFAAFFRQAGIASTGTIRLGTAQPGADRLILRQPSPLPLSDVVAKLMTYSNNFTANQILIATGIHRFGPPGNLEKGLAAVREFLERELGLTGVVMEEGSGISRNNRVSAHDMLRVLDRFARYHDLLRRQPDEWYKTGSLSGVRTRAGFLQGPAGGRYPFVVFMNTPGKTTDAVMDALRTRVDGDG